MRDEAGKAGWTAGDQQWRAGRTGELGAEAQGPSLTFEL